MTVLRTEGEQYSIETTLKWVFCWGSAGKQAAYLDFDFGGRIHNTETLKKAGKSATWEHPVQLTGAGVNMKVPPPPSAYVHPLACTHPYSPPICHW